MRCAGLVMAGGAASRMGGTVPKPLVAIGGRSCLDNALGLLAPRCAPLIVGAPRQVGFERAGAALVPDLRDERLGPLAALEAAYRHLSGEALPVSHLIAVPGDTPFLPADLVQRLAGEAGAKARVARFAGRWHPSVALWPLEALAGLTARLDRPETTRSLMAFLEIVGFEPVDFPPNEDAPGGDPFFNLNTPSDLEIARRFLG